MRAEVAVHASLQNSHRLFDKLEKYKTKGRSTYGFLKLFEINQAITAKPFQLLLTVMQIFLLFCYDEQFLAGTLDVLVHRVVSDR